MVVADGPDTAFHLDRAVDVAHDDLLCVEGAVRTRPSFNLDLLAPGENRDAVGRRHGRGGPDKDTHDKARGEHKPHCENLCSTFVRGRGGEPGGCRRYRCD